MAGVVAYVGAVAERSAADVTRITWTPPRDRPLDELASWVGDQVTPVVDGLAKPLLIGKSLGSFAAPVAADRELPAVWLTPLLTEPQCVEGLRRSSAPFVLVGGTADEFWDGSLARELTPHVVEVENADHGMLVPGPMSASTDVLGRIVRAVEEFVAEVGWT